MRRKELKLTAFLLFILFANNLFAQQSTYIFGKLIDSTTKEPIVFASIHLKNRSVGVISNLDGGFRIPETYRDLGDILVISSMGYVEQELQVADLFLDKTNLIVLQPATFELNEVVLEGRKKRNLSALKIIRKAVEQIPENYPLEAFSTVGYYRDYQIEEGQYVNLNEALLEVFDQGFNTIDTTSSKTQIYDYAENKEFKRDTLSEKPYNYKEGSKVIDKAILSGFGGNEFSILKVHDAIRNYKLNSYDFINGLKDLDLIKNHSVKKASEINLDDELIYVIELNRKKDGYLSNGLIYISKTDFAIHKLEYAVYDNAKMHRKLKVRKTGVKGKLIFESTTEYKRNENDKMYLNYTSFHNSFRLRMPPKFTLDKVLLDIGAKRFELTFNNAVDTIDAIDYKNYKGLFKGRSIKFRSVVNIDNTVYLYPRLEKKKQLLMWNQLKTAVENDKLTKGLIDFKFGKISDINGNLLNKPYYKDFNQFREFFVQEVKPDPNFENENVLMDKRIPLFQNQPVLKPANFSDYWMNTPLKTIEN